MGNYKLPLGFRFHPTDVELLKYYLKRKVLGKKFCFEAIAELDIYKHAPWDLPDMSLLRTGDLKWFFFCPIEKKYARGARLNRATVYGQWKATGKDKPVMYNEEVVGMMKTLVFHQGRAPHGDRTDWVMHEYRLEDKELADRGVVQDSYVLCVVFKKDGLGPRNGAQYGAPFKEEDWSDEDEDGNLVGTGSLSVLSTLAFGGATSSSHVPESRSAEPSVQSSGLCTLAPVPNAALTSMDTPQVVVVDDKAVHAVNEASQLAQVPKVQESNDKLLSMSEIFKEDDAGFLTYNNNGQMTGNANDFTLEAAQDSIDDGISLMLASLSEEENFWNSVFYPLE